MIILDMQMPVMGGIEAAKLYRMMYPDKKVVPILILTANATTEAVSEVEEAGLDAYLSKPVEPQKLLDTISTLARKKSRKHGESIRPRLQLVSNNDEQLPVLDKNTLDEISSMTSGKEFMQELINGYLEDSGKIVSSITTLYEQQKLSDIGDLAHSLDGSSRSIGAKRLAAIAEDICRLIRNDEGTNFTRSHLDRLAATFSDTHSDMMSYLEQGDSEAAY